MFVLTKGSSNTIPAHCIAWKGVHPNGRMVFEVFVSEIGQRDISPKVGILFYSAEIERSWMTDFMVTFEGVVSREHIPRRLPVSVDLLLVGEFLTDGLTDAFERIIAYGASLTVTWVSEETMEFALTIGELTLRQKLSSPSFSNLFGLGDPPALPPVIASAQ